MPLDVLVPYVLRRDESKFANPSEFRGGSVGIVGTGLRGDARDLLNGLAASSKRLQRALHS
jgi:hypothetical protein